MQSHLDDSLNQQHMFELPWSSLANSNFKHKKDTLEISGGMQLLHIQHAALTQNEQP